MLALFRLSRFLLTLISKISLWFLWQVQKSSHDRWFPVSSFEGPELRPTMVKRRLAVRPISMRQLPLLLPLGHKEILVSQVPIIQGRGTKSKLAFYVSNRYDTILILCFCMPIKRDRDKPAASVAPFCSFLHLRHGKPIADWVSSFGYSAGWPVYFVPQTHNPRPPFRHFGQPGSQPVPKPKVKLKQINKPKTLVRSVNLLCVSPLVLAGLAALLAYKAIT